MSDNNSLEKKLLDNHEQKINLMEKKIEAEPSYVSSLKLPKIELIMN